MFDDVQEEKTEETQKGSKPARPVLFVIDIRNPLWGIFSWLGGVDIAPSQYERRIAFSFGDSARILEAGAVEEEPQDIGAEVYADHFPPDKLVLKPVLLNQGDRVRLRAVVEAPDREPPSQWFGRKTLLLKSYGHFAINVEGRILGVRSIRRKRGYQELMAYGILLDFIALLPLTVGSIVGGIVWLLTGNPNLFMAAPSPWFIIPAPSPVDVLMFTVTGAQTALLIAGQFLLMRAVRRTLKSAKIAEKYSPPSSDSIPMN